MTKSLRSIVFWNAISQFGNSGISFLSTIILARLLTPNDFGIIGIVSIFLALSQMMIDSQMGGALLRKKEVTIVDYSTLFWYNLAVSIIIYLLLFLLAPLVSNIYGRPPLIAIIRVICISIIIYALRITQRVMLIREFKFRTLAIINIVSGIVSLFCAILLAIKGFGYWSLVIMHIVSAIIGLILMLLYNHFIPRLHFSKESFRYQFRFGINLLGAEAAITIANNISTNIIAKISNLSFTGYYTQSSRITNFIQGSFTGILDQSIFPYMSRLRNMNKISNLYKRLTCLVLILSSIISICFIIFGNIIIQIILGEEWLKAGGIFKVLSLAILPGTLQALSKNVLKTIGSTNKILHIETFKSILLIILIFTAGIISTFAIIWAYVLTQYITCIIWIVYTRQKLNNKDLILNE